MIDRPRRCIRLISLISAIALSAAILPVAFAADGNPNATADGSGHPFEITFEGQPIPVGKMVGLHCDDVAYPVIHCFRTAAERDADAGIDTTSWTGSNAIASLSNGPRSDSGLAPQATSTQVYVVWYDDINYGGGSYATTINWSNLGDINWNDRISSYKQPNSGWARFYRDSNYGSIYSESTYIGASISYVGNYDNDQYSSVLKLN
jgi:hypothetical protein